MLPTQTSSSGRLSWLVKLAKRKSQGPNPLDKLNDGMARLSRRKETISGSMITPYSVYRSECDSSEKNSSVQLSERQAFKAGFLLKCVEDGLTLDEIEKKADELLTKQANPSWLAGLGLSHLFRGGVGLTGLAGDLATTALIGGPIIAGGLGGYVLAKNRSKPDIEGIKREEIRDEYTRLANEVRNRTMIRKLQNENPGAIVKL